MVFGVVVDGVIRAVGGDVRGYAQDDGADVRWRKVEIQLGYGDNENVG